MTQLSSSECILDMTLERGNMTIGRYTYLAAAMAAISCTGAGLEERPDTALTDIFLYSGDSMKTRSEDPQEDLITDMNLFIFNDRGIMESSMYFTAAQMEGTGDGHIIKTGLLANATYSVYALANAGYPIQDSSLRDTSDITGLRYYMTYPDEYRTGIPMSGHVKDITVRQGSPVYIRLERTMARISLAIDRSRLDSDVEFFVRRVSIGGCPRYVTPFRESAVISGDGMFISGFSKDESQVQPLNRDIGFGRSGSIDVYMFENLQGNQPGGYTDDSGKIPDGPDAALCSYIEITADYLSDSHYSLPGKELIYRFYLGEDRDNFDIRRNTWYRFTVTPEADGLREDSWRVDKSGIGTFIKEIRLSYSSARLTYQGEKVQLYAYVYPEDATSDGTVWSSSDASVASVSEDGLVSANGEGSCTIYCHATDGSGSYAECRIECTFSPYYMKVYPGNFIRGKTGETYHVRCEFFPGTAEFDIGMEELEYDHSRGIYDYTVDDDGKGVWLTFRKKGSGLLYFEAGYPVNQSELVVISVE